MNNDLQKDSTGNVVTMPMTGWQMFGLAGSATLLVIQYAETLAKLETNDNNQIQLAMTPEQCLQLAEALKRAGKSLLEDVSHAN